MELNSQASAQNKVMGTTYPVERLPLMCGSGIVAHR